MPIEERPNVSPFIIGQYRTIPLDTRKIKPFVAPASILNMYSDVKSVIKDYIEGQNPNACKEYKKQHPEKVRCWRK